MNRRTFLSRLAFLSIFQAIALSPLSAFFSSASSKIKKIILPHGTKRQDLIDKDPARLDPRNLDITPLREFGTMGLSDYRITLKHWQLRVEGHVDKPLALSYERITFLPAMEKKVLLICPGVFANYGVWKGVSIKSLLKEAGASKKVTHVTISGPESRFNKTERFSIQDVLDDKLFLAYAVNGVMLPQKHGYPLRLVAEGQYGFRWVKYVDRIRAEIIKD